MGDEGGGGGFRGSSCKYLMYIRIKGWTVGE